MQVFGMKFFPGSRVSLGAAVEHQGVDFVSLANLQICKAEGVINVQQLPKSRKCMGAPGSFDLAFTPDGQYAFVANEYGTLPNADNVSGTVGVLSVHRDGRGYFDAGADLIPAGHREGAYINIPGGRAIAGVTMSHDGKRLYVTSEIAESGYQNPTHTENRKLSKDDCVQGEPVRTHNGLLTVIDVDKAKLGYGRLSIMRTIASGCSPVRIVESADGKMIWVTARGDNRVLGFDVNMLLSQRPNESFVGHADSGGTAPVGLALFNNDRLLAVANSNRFHAKDGVASVGFIDVREPSKAMVVKSLVLENEKSFPRNVKVGPDDSTLYVTLYNADKLEVIKTTVK